MKCKSDLRACAKRVEQVIAAQRIADVSLELKRAGKRTTEHETQHEAAGGGIKVRGDDVCHAVAFECQAGPGADAVRIPDCQSCRDVRAE